MRAINTGNVYKIYDNSMVTLNNLPPQFYSVRFDKMEGFFLEKHASIEITESKIYGVHDAKVNKVLDSFDNFNRSLGVILSGDKGIGKSLYAKLLSVKAVKSGIPVIIIDRYIPGIATFIESIEQDVMILFDEFDKTFGSETHGKEAQNSLLSLFDGIAQGKKLFVITCNDIVTLNDYLVNRPGRFHYHLRFEYPTIEEIEIYLKDKVKPEYWDEISKVLLFARKANLNYDCLRAIAYELNYGETFGDAIKDLNINGGGQTYYNCKLVYENKKFMTLNYTKINLFAETDEYLWFKTEGVDDTFTQVHFETNNVVYNEELKSLYLPANKFTVYYDESYIESECTRKAYEEFKDLKPEYIVLERSMKWRLI